MLLIPLKAGFQSSIGIGCSSHHLGHGVAATCARITIRIGAIPRRRRWRSAGPPTVSVCFANRTVGNRRTKAGRLIAHLLGALWAKDAFRRNHE
jgi:hypothetical protein